MKRPADRPDAEDVDARRASTARHPGMVPARRQRRDPARTVPPGHELAARRVGEPEAQSRRAAAATVPGITPLTPHYASPEQVRGEAVTTASDVYSLAISCAEVSEAGQL